MVLRRILVIGAGGLGCELLKDLALLGFGNIEVIDMDTIDVSNLNRQFLFRMKDVGQPKAVVAASRIQERVEGCTVVPHFGRIEDKPAEFYRGFHIIVLGLDSVEARAWINETACSFLEHDEEGNVDLSTVKPLVDGGTEGFKGHARVILPGITPCFACTMWLFPPQTKFPLCESRASLFADSHSRSDDPIPKFPSPRHAGGDAQDARALHRVGPPDQVAQGQRDGGV